MERNKHSKDPILNNTEQVIGFGEEAVEDLDIFTLHLNDMGKFAIDQDANSRCARAIVDGQFSQLRLAKFRDEDVLTNEQDVFLKDFFEKPRIKRLKKGLVSKLNKVDVSDNMKASHEQFLEKVAAEARKTASEIVHLKKLSTSSRAQEAEVLVGAEVEKCKVAEDALDELVLRNMRLGVCVAKKQPRTFLSIEDRCQIAYEGLMIAATTYDPESGYRFSTYAIYWAKQKVRRAISDQESVIRIPVQVREQYRGSNKVIESKIQEFGRELTGSEVEDLLGNRVVNFRRAEISQSVASINKPVVLGEEGRISLENSLESDESAVEEEGINRAVNDEITHALYVLTPRERIVLEFRFGLLDGKERTLEQVGGELKITRERVRQIEFKAFAKLRKHFRSSGLHE